MYLLFILFGVYEKPCCHLTIRSDIMKRITELLNMSMFSQTPENPPVGHCKHNM